MRFFILMAILIGVGISMSAQPSCLTKYSSYYRSTPLLNSLPPLSSGMSINEILGHIALDSICRELELSQIDSFMMARSTWDDTLKSMHKYMTTIVDSDPLLVFKINHAISEWRLTFPDEVRGQLALSVSKHSPYPNIDAALATCDYILTVSINDTARIVDTSAQVAKTAIVATGAIADTLFGRKFPDCSGPQQLPSTSTSSKCITFDTRREQVQFWRDRKGLTADSTVVETMVPKPTRQYLVFMKLVRLCSDTSNVYYTLFPSYSIGPRCGIYEIQSGRILDEQNYFGLGSNPLLLDVVAAIETRLVQVKTWVP